MLDNNAIQLLLQNESAQLISEIRALIISTGANASGKTARSMEAFTKVNKNKYSLLITGGGSFNYIERGRGPTQRGSGKGKLKSIIRQWIDDKGIQPDKGMTKDTLAFLITRAIHQRGTLLNFLGEVREIQSAVLTEKRFDSLYTNLGNLITEQVAKELISSIKQ